MSINRQNKFHDCDKPTHSLVLNFLVKLTFRSICYFCSICTNCAIHLC